MWWALTWKVVIDTNMFSFGTSKSIPHHCLRKILTWCTLAEIKMLFQPNFQVEVSRRKVKETLIKSSATKVYIDNHLKFSETQGELKWNHRQPEYNQRLWLVWIDELWYDRQVIWEAVGSWLSKKLSRLAFEKKENFWDSNT